VKPPISEEGYANNAVKDVLRQYCAAYEAQDPDAVQRVYPKAEMSSLRRQLDRSRYKSIACAFGTPKFEALDIAGGTARIHVDIKHVLERTTVGSKPEVLEYVATVSLSRASQRGRWFIDTAEFQAKPQQK
jgi:hypothetical protein